MNRRKVQEKEVSDDEEKPNKKDDEETAEAALQAERDSFEEQLQDVSPTVSANRNDVLEKDAR